MATYSELAALSPWSYLQPHLFSTPNDHLPPKEYAQQQLASGIKIGTEYSIIHISSTSVWSASRHLEACNSQEGIGYHSCTRQLLEGFLQSPAKIIVHRQSTAAGYYQTTIKPAGWWVKEVVQESNYQYQIRRIGEPSVIETGIKGLIRFTLYTVDQNV